MSRTRAEIEFLGEKFELLEPMSIQINIRMTPTDYDKFCRVASHKNMGRSELIRHWIKHGQTGGL